MKVKKPSTENERVFATFLLIFLVFFGADGLFSLFFAESASIMHYQMSLSFILGMAAGMGFYLWARAGGRPTVDRSMDILQRALTDDEMLLLEIIRDREGIAQEDLRHNTGFSRSKVSVLLLDLEKKGLIERRRKGRTKEVLLAEWLKK
jgi:uncharacterized membrane protein